MRIKSNIQWYSNNHICISYQFRLIERLLNDPCVQPTTLVLEGPGKSHYDPKYTVCPPNDWHSYFRYGENKFRFYF